MNIEQYQSLVQAPQLVIGVSDLKNKSDRTLLWGYTIERHSWHVYLKNKEFYLYVYAGHPTYPSGINSIRKEWLGKWIEHPKQMIPTKRLYPEACDYEFCCLLYRLKEISLPFTTFNTERPIQPYYGELF